MNVDIERKVTVGALIGAVGVIAVYTIQSIWPILIPAEVAMAGQTLVIFGVQYWVANK